ncbi:MAG: hypothetical protein SFU98_09435 [Leptospiraceae bacterium]|nr:hypothetical protein [Leptospiraceae bacterium]
MEFIAHRINTTQELKKIPNNFGVELDLRDSGSKLILVHDPFSEGEDFQTYLQEYNHGTMILNIKSERIENRVLEAMKGSNVNKYFFLDSSFPMIVKLSSEGEKNLALRFSEFEPIDGVYLNRNKADWVWVDCFKTFPLNFGIYSKLKELGFKICIVSPELQGQDSKIEAYGEYMKSLEIFPDAICSKIYNYERWKHFFPELGT